MEHLEADQHTREVRLDYNSHGDASLLGAVDVPNQAGTEMRAAKFDHSTGQWSAVEKIADSSGSNAMMGTVMGENGEQASIWPDSNISWIAAATTVNGQWQPAEQINGSSTPLFVMPTINIDAEGNVIAAWQGLAGDFSDAQVEYSVFDGQWSDPELVPEGLHSGAPFLADGPDRGLVLTRIGDGTPRNLASSAPVAANVWDPATKAWGNSKVIANAEAAGFRTLARTAIDSLGNVVTLWSRVGSSDFPVLVAALDRSAPTLSSVSAPSSATVGDAISVSVTTTDLWSSTSVDWDFGDGGTGDGTSDTHTYTSPGTYTIRATSTDAAGNEAERTSSITIKAAAAPQPPAPADDDEDTVVDDVKPPAKPPVVNAPVIEAKLAGKTVTYNAKLSLKGGQSCSGTVTATFTFGNKRYTSKLKLKKVGNACRATGKTTLKKSPSTRTKITVKLSGKQVKTRSLSTKRG